MQDLAILVSMAFGIVTVLAISVCVFLPYDKKSSKAANKEQVSEE